MSPAELIPPSSRTEPDCDNYGFDEVETVERKPCKQWTKFYYCNRCGKVHSITHTCNQKYGRCCFPERKKRNYARLMELKIKSKRLIHVVIGFKKTKNLPNKERKRDKEKALGKLRRKIRKELGLKWNGIRIFDLADDGSYSHYHYALVPEKAMMNGRTLNIDVNKIRKLLENATNGDSIIIKVIGFKSKGNLFYYFSQRIAGKYGHGGNTFFLEDIMTYQEYHDGFFNVRSVTKLGFPKGISCSNALSIHRCPYCNSDDIVLVDILAVGEPFKPPDWLVEYEKWFTRNKLSRLW